MITLKRIAQTNILLILLGSLFARLEIDRIEKHALENSLHPGYDTFGRNCWGLTFTAISNTLISIVPLLVFALCISILLALLASATAGPIRFLIRSILDLFSALPGFLIALSLGVLFPRAEFTAYLATLLMVLPSTTRYFESFLLKLRAEDFITASSSMGASPLHIWIQHLIPALRDSIVTILPFVLLRLILIETSLSFLGLTLTPEHETWGRLLAQGKDYLIEAPWILRTAALPLCLLLASFHLLSHEDQN